MITSSSSDDSDVSMSSEEFINKWRQLQDSSSTMQPNTSMMEQQSTSAMGEGSQFLKRKQVESVITTKSKERKRDDGLGVINEKRVDLAKVLPQKPHGDLVEVVDETVKIQKQPHVKPGVGSALQSIISNVKGGESSKRKQTLDNNKTTEILHNEIHEIKTTLNRFISETNFKFQGLVDVTQELKKKKIVTDRTGTKRVTLTLLNQKLDQILEYVET